MTAASSAAEESLRAFSVSIRSGLRPALIAFSQSTLDGLKQNPDAVTQNAELWRSDPSLHVEISRYLSNNDKTDDPLCNVFFDWFFSGHRALQNFVLSFIPLLVELYLTNLHSTKKPHLISGIETVLLGIYAWRVRVHAGSPLVWHPPTLSTSSIYHTIQIDSRSTPKMNNRRHATTVSPGGVEAENTHSHLTTSGKSNGAANGVATVSVYNDEKSGVRLEPPLPLIGDHGIRSYERERILREVLRQFVQGIGLHHPFVLESYCNMTARLCSSGFPFSQSTVNEEPTVRNVMVEHNGTVMTQQIQVLSSRPQSGTNQRVPLSAGFLQALAEGIHYCVFHHTAKLAGIWALDILEKRATYDLHPSVLVTVKAIRRTTRAPLVNIQTSTNTPRIVEPGELLRGQSTNIVRG